MQARRPATWFLLLAIVLVLFSVVAMTGCGTDINKDLLKPLGGQSGCIEQLPGNDTFLTAQDIGEISPGQRISVCGVVEQTGGALSLGSFYSFLLSETTPEHSILEGNLHWDSESFFVIDVWSYVVEDIVLPIPLPLGKAAYLEKTDSHFRLEITFPPPPADAEPQELQVAVKGKSGEPGPYTFEISLTAPTE